MIAGAENLTPRRIRQIVRQSLRLRQIDPAGAHVRLQTARLDASLRLAADRIEDGELGAIDRLLRVLDRLDRYQTRAAAPAFDEAAEGAARFDARLDDLVATAAADKARAAARGGRTAARLTARRRNARGAPSFDVEAPAEAVRAIAGLGLFGAPFGLAPTPAAAGAFERPETAGAGGPQ